MPSWMLMSLSLAVSISAISGRVLRREAWARVLGTVRPRGLVALRCLADVRPRYRFSCWWPFLDLIRLVNIEDRGCLRFSVLSSLPPEAQYIVS